MHNHIACNSETLNKYRGNHAPFKESSHNIANLKARELERAKRLLNDDTRRMGLDLPCLAIQTELKQQANERSFQEKAAESAAIRLAVSQMEILAIENMKAAQLSKQKYAEELQEQIRLKRENFETVCAAQVPPGPSSMQRFDGEDIGGSEKRRAKAKEHIEYIARQIVSREEEKEILHAHNSISSKIEDSVRDQILNRHHVQRQFNADNLRMCLEKRKPNILQEPEPTTLPETRVHTRQTDYKGVSLSETKSTLITGNAPIIKNHQDALSRVKWEGIEEAKMLEKERLWATQIEAETAEIRRRELVHNLTVSAIHAKINREESQIKADSERVLDAQYSEKFLNRFGSSLY